MSDKAKTCSAERAYSFAVAGAIPAALVVLGLVAAFVAFLLGCCAAVAAVVITCAAAATIFAACGLVWCGLLRLFGFRPRIPGPASALEELRRG